MYLRRFTSATFIVLAWIGEAHAECSARFEGSTFTVLPAYNPFSPTDVVTRKNLQIRNLSGENCRYRIHFRRNPALGEFSRQLRYDVVDDQNQSLLAADVGPSASRFLLSSPASAQIVQSVGYLVNVERGQIASPGVLADQIEVALFSENGQTEIDSRGLYLWVAVESVSMVSLAGGGVATTVQFGNLITGMTRSLILEAHSNTPYTMSFASNNNGNLELEPPVPGRAWSIPYRLLVDGTSFDLSRENYIQSPSSASGRRSHSITFQIINADAKRAGRYKDVITAKILPVY